jgi:hypothetical protein
MLGGLGEPGNHADLISEIRHALRKPKSIPSGLEYFDWGNFVRRIDRSLEQLMQDSNHDH